MGNVQNSFKMRVGLLILKGISNAKIRQERIRTHSLHFSVKNWKV
jgi:hypothetical protein